MVQLHIQTLLSRSCTSCLCCHSTSLSYPVPYFSQQTLCERCKTEHRIQIHGMNARATYRSSPAFISCAPYFGSKKMFSLSSKQQAQLYVLNSHSIFIYWSACVARNAKWAMSKMPVLRVIIVTLITLSSPLCGLWPGTLKCVTDCDNSIPTRGAKEGTFVMRRKISLWAITRTSFCWCERHDENCQ